ncbi:hypothetical protein FisN_24Lh105 [Fistulifera solaris]|uniref:UDENN domain-containing protein n=1 Tax=Fistulifera solaris TaxID=1519565 RepID=A0A1Z5K9J0_FISSO|nr:hypothetical protein FisN_24Lh105 [Fistulifera solaris]|eukprot:GAX22822.1 hypothetical protein FisN_24Lh105 [Fistulifera solaris]
MIPDTKCTSTTLNQLLSIPSNRVCADCHSILVDASQVFVSFPQHDTDDDNSILYDEEEEGRTVPDPADEAADRVAFMGVLICSLCADAHDLLLYQHVPRPPPALLPYIHNQRAAQTLEAYYNPSILPRPSSDCSKAERWLFVRAKYEALAFCLPPTQHHVMAKQAWTNILQRHHWDQQFPQLCHLESSFSRSTHLYTTTHAQNTDLQRNRLVRYFCVLTPSETLDTLLMTMNLKQNHHHTQSPHPEQIFLAPQVADCFPEPEDDFPSHLGLLVFPQGCHARTRRSPPSFFTFCVTTGTGERLYGAVLQVYDDVHDAQHLYNIWESASLHPPRKDHPPNKSNQPPQELFFPKCLVLLSYHPYWDLFRKFLCLIYRVALTPAPLPLERYIAHFVAQVPIPPPNVQIQLSYTAAAPPWTILQSGRWPLREFSFQPLFSCLRISHILIVWGCLLREQKVVLCTQQESSSLLTPVAEALICLLYPFQWQGVYLPVMPKHMAELLEAPVPFLLGLQGPLPTNRPQDDDIVWVGLDTDQVILGGGCGGLPALPERDANKLKHRLLNCAAGLYMPFSPVDDSMSVNSGSKLRSSYSNAMGFRYAQCLPVELISNRSQTREEILSSINRAYRDAELYQPVRLIEQGAMSISTSSPRATVSPSVKSSLSSSRFPRKRRARSKTGSFGNSSPRNVDDSNLFSLQDPDGFCSSDIRSSFFKFFVSVFRDYRQFIRPDEETFQYNAFVASLSINAKQQNYVKSVLNTQLFSSFLQECHQEPPSPHVQFLDDAIQAKSVYMKRVLQRQMSNHSSSYLPNELEHALHETYTPPPPSHIGLPEDQSNWQYASFPTLDLSLIGPLRAPRQFDYSANTRSAAISGDGLIAGLHPWQNYSQRLFQQAAQKQPFSVMARLEQALGTMMAPFGPSPTARSLRGLQRGHASSNLSFQRKTESQEMIWNTRRKQSILIGIFMALQRHGRLYISKKQNHQLTELRALSLEATAPMAMNPDVGAHVLQHFFRGVLLKKQFRTTRWLASLITARIRGRKVRIAYNWLKKAIARIQAHVRGLLLRKQLFRTVLPRRIHVYRKCVFELWKHDHTPLTHRTLVWSCSSGRLLLQHAFLEEELRRLWNNLHRSTDLFVSKKVRPNDRFDDELLNLQLGLKMELYWMARQVCVSSDYMDIPKNTRSSREATERLQIYERLVLKDDDEMLKTFCRDLGCPTKMRYKKTWLAQNVWQSFTMATSSAQLMKGLFPELNGSADIYLIPPSRKSLKRIPADPSVSLPPNLPNWSRRVQQNVVEVARLGLLQHYWTPRGRCLKKLADRWIDVVMEHQHISSAIEARVFLMKRELKPNSRF